MTIKGVGSGPLPLLGNDFFGAPRPTCVTPLPSGSFSGHVHNHCFVFNTFTGPQLHKDSSSTFMPKVAEKESSESDLSQSPAVLVQSHPSTAILLYYHKVMVAIFWNEYKLDLPSNTSKAVIQLPTIHCQIELFYLILKWIPYVVTS